MNNKRNWEQMGAASGLLAAALFVAAFIVFTSTSPTGSPPLPSIQNAEQAPAFLAAHLSTVRIELLLLTLGIVLFLWFVGSLWSSLRQAEGDPARGAMLAVVGASVGAALMLVGVVLSFASGLSTSPAQAQGVPTLYTASALLFAFGGGALSIFFFAVGKVIVGTAVMGRWLGWLALLGGVLAALAFMTPFFETGILNAATGALGLWAWWVTFVLWVFLASLTLTLQERRRWSAAPAQQPVARPEGAV